MKRRLLNLLTVLSLLLCVPVVVMWVRSYWVEDWICHRRLHPTVGHRASATDWMFSTSRGMVHTGVSIVGWDTRLFDFGWYSGDGWRWETERGVFGPKREPNRLGFAYDWFDPTPDDDTWSRDVRFPLWLPAVFPVFPVLHLRGSRPLRLTAATSSARLSQCHSSGFHVSR